MANVDQPRRPEPAAHYRVFVKRAIVTALRSVFTAEYPDPEFRNMWISTEYPLEKISYPLVIVKFNAGTLMNAGVGHEEMAFDENGHWTKYYHSRFEGSLELHTYALSSFSQDLLSDSIDDLIRHGKLQTLTNQFYETIFDDYGNGGQLMLQTDQITDLGVSVGKPFWNPEDTLVYMGGHSMVCHGAFYSTGQSELSAFFDRIVILPYIEGEEVPAGQIDITAPWAPTPPSYEDMWQVRMDAEIEADEEYTAGP